MSLTAAMAAQANADHNLPLMFVRIDYGITDPFLAVTAPFNIAVTGTSDSNLDGNTFLPLDGLSISDFKQDVSGAIQEITLALALKESSDFLTVMEDDVWWGSAARLWFAYFDSDFTTLILSPSLRISGFLDKLTLTVDAGIAVVTGVIRTNRMLFDRNRGNRYTSAQHESRYAGDLAFSFLPRLASGELLLANDKPTNVGRYNSAPHYYDEEIARRQWGGYPK